MKSLLRWVNWRRFGPSSSIGARITGSLCLVLLGALSAVTAMAQVVSPVRLIVPFATGGATDIGARVIAPYLTELTKRSEEHTSELQSQSNLVCRLLLEKKKQ